MDNATSVPPDSQLIIEAEELYRLGEKDEAAKILDTYISDNPDDISVAVLNRAGEIHLELDHADKAIECFTAVAESFAKDGSPEKAIVIYRRALRVDNDRLKIHQRLVELCKKNGTPELAEESKTFILAHEYASKRKSFRQQRLEFETAKHTERRKTNVLFPVVEGLSEELSIVSYIARLDEAKRTTLLNEIDKAAPRSNEQKIIAIIKNGENEKAEFKSSARWDINKSEKNIELTRPILRTIAAFLNSNGGTLFIGVDDHGEILGLKNDFDVSFNKNKDGFLLFIGDILSDTFGKDVAEYVSVNIHEINGNELCAISVRPAVKAFYIKEGKDESLYVRITSGTRKLTSKETVEYHNTHWKK